MILISANNASTQLGSGISSGTTTIPLATGTGSLFPSPAAGQFFSLTLNDALTGDIYEICYCTSRTADNCTVMRGQEGTSARAWLIGDFAYNALTSGEIATFANINGNASQNFAAAILQTQVLQAPATEILYLESDINTASYNRGGSGYIQHLCAPAAVAQGAVTLSQISSGSNSNGFWSKTPDGTITQQNNLQTTTGQFITFPIAFTDLPSISVVVSESNAGLATWGSNAPSLHGLGGITLTGFTKQNCSWNGSSWLSSGVSLSTCWIAKGR